MKWKLEDLLEGLHRDVQHRLDLSRSTYGHSTDLGDASENVWREMLEKYLPARYQVGKATVIDSNGETSDQIDIVIFDRNYTPFILNSGTSAVVPSESVYAVFESKQETSAQNIKYAQNKVASVRRLYRTSLPVPYVEGLLKPKPLHHIIGGLLTFDSSWTPPLGKPLIEALEKGPSDGRLDMGCVAKHGLFGCDPSGCHTAIPHAKPATAFLFDLISKLQDLGTVPRIDIGAYGNWLS